MRISNPGPASNLSMRTNQLAITWGPEVRADTEPDSGEEDNVQVLQAELNAQEENASDDSQDE